MKLSKGAHLHKNSFGYGLAKIVGFVFTVCGILELLVASFWIATGGGPTWVLAMGAAGLAIWTGQALLVWEPPGSLATLQDLQRDTVYYTLGSDWFGKDGLTVLISTLEEPTHASTLALHVPRRSEALPMCFMVARIRGKYIIRAVTD